jgi:peptidoglycan-N-acetylglucosamine deacetylase
MTWLQNGWIQVLVILVLFWIGYEGVPELLFHALRWRVFSKGIGDARMISLTFDDGPDPRYTPELLALLKEYDAKATFFVVGKHVRNHPDLLREIVNQGHEVGVHGFHHLNAWYLSPWKTMREFLETASAIEAVTGQKPRYYRPPWGMFNAVTRLAGKRIGAIPVLWNVTCYDWRKGDQTAAITKRLMQRVGPGSVVLLHDSGGAPNAPANTISALRQVLPYYKQLEYQLVTIGTLLRHSETVQAERAQIKQKRIQAIWNLWEWLFTKLYRVHSIDPMVRLSINTWKHASKWDEQGRLLVQKGDCAAEIHFQNEFLQSQSTDTSPERLAVKLIRQFRTSLHHVALTLQYDPRYRDVKAIYGVTLMHRGAAGAGFHVEDIPNSFGKKYLQLFLRWLMVLYHPQGTKRLKTRTEALVPKLVWMSREEVLEKYLNRESKAKESRIQIP